MERHRLLWLYLQERTRFFSKGYKVLDVAPVKFLADRWEEFFENEYESIDLASPLAKRLMDVTDLKYPPDHFDWIICFHVLEHVPDDRKAMREFFRVLKPGGYGILQVPLFSGLTYEDPSIVTPDERQKAFGQSDHVRKYGSDYPDRLQSAGFEVTVDHFVKEVGNDKVQEYGLPHWEDLFLVRKPQTA